MMKKILLLTVLLMAFIGCEETPLSQYTALKIESAVTSLYVGQTAQLTYKAEPAEVKEAVVWSSSDDKILSVDQKGAVKGMKEGTATVTLVAKADPKLASSVKIEVVTDPNPSEVTGVFIYDGETKVEKELTLTLTRTGEEFFVERDFGAEVEFSEEDKDVDKTVTWDLESQNPEGVFTLSDTGVFTAKGRGVAVIKATANAAPSVSATLTVRAVAEGDVTSLEIVDATGYAFADNSLMLLESGEGVGVQVFVYPESAAQTAVWSVSSDRIQICDSNGDAIDSTTAYGFVKLKAVSDSGESTTDAEPLTVTATVEQTGLEPVTATLTVGVIESPVVTLGGYTDAWIEGEILTVDLQDEVQEFLEVTGVSTNDMTYNAQDNAVTVGSEKLDASLTVSYRTVKGRESGSTTVTGQIYANTNHIRFGNNIFEEINDSGIVFFGNSLPSGVSIGKRESGGRFEAAEGDTHYTLDTEGLRFGGNLRDIRILYPKNSLPDVGFQLLALKVKWTSADYQPTLYIVDWQSDSDIYAFYFYKNQQSGFARPGWTINQTKSYSPAPVVNDWNTFKVFEGAKGTTVRSATVNNGVVNVFDAFNPDNLADFRFDSPRGGNLEIAFCDDNSGTDQKGDVIVQSLRFYNPVGTN